MEPVNDGELRKLAVLFFTHRIWPNEFPAKTTVKTSATENMMFFMASSCTKLFLSIEQFPFPSSHGFEKLKIFIGAGIKKRICFQRTG